MNPVDMDIYYSKISLAYRLIEVEFDFGIVRVVANYLQAPVRDRVEREIVYLLLEKFDRSPVQI